uniref:Uncharacterized protein n=1 Tax=Romanomermis culicivorax TaxID=13658 RepID=A0A915HN10_ROMCU
MVYSAAADEEMTADACDCCDRPASCTLMTSAKMASILGLLNGSFVQHISNILGHSAPALANKVG